MKRDQELIIRLIVLEDLHRIWTLLYGEAQPEWKKWDAPYFPHVVISYDEWLKNSVEWLGSQSRWAIEVNGIVAGIISYYWEHEPSLWLEMGIVLHEANSWGKGIGTRSMKLWIEHLFETMPLVRVGYTTWSGNKRMIAVGEKIGMQKEAQIRKVRYYNGEYFDSIRMGMLREEWEERLRVN
ncbi:MAG: GNAT family N-acetyltransferase [Bacilli bacterium]